MTRAESNESPCVGVCIVNPRTGYCAGCFRTVAEISHWRSMDAGGREAVLAECARRRARVRTTSEDARKRSFAGSAGA